MTAGGIKPFVAVLTSGNANNGPRGAHLMRKIVQNWASQVGADNVYHLDTVVSIVL